MKKEQSKFILKKIIKDIRIYIFITNGIEKKKEITKINSNKIIPG